MVANKIISNSRLSKKIQMTNEQVKKAALQHAMNETGLDYIGEVACENGFIAGAQYRINSVWHKPSAYGDELARDVEVIAKTKRGYRFGKFGVSYFSHEYVCFISTSGLDYALSDVLEYAYLSDLLPERKEMEK